VSALTCKHKDIPEAVEWPELDALEHFTDCLLPRERAQYWHLLMERQAEARQCWEADHKRRLEANGSYTLKLLTGIREAIERLDGAEYGEVLDVRAKLQDLIS
jgi:hypothetical protein